ncbi:MAG: hypothetical protein AAGC86_13895 [Pseudomonadota bacterium]
MVGKVGATGLDGAVDAVFVAQKSSRRHFGLVGHRGLFGTITVGPRAFVLGEKVTEKRCAASDQQISGCRDIACKSDAFCGGGTHEILVGAAPVAEGYVGLVSRGAMSEMPRPIRQSSLTSFELFVVGVGWILLESCGSLRGRDHGEKFVLMLKVHQRWQDSLWHRMPR